MKSYRITTVAILTSLWLITSCTNEHTVQQPEQTPVNVLVASPVINTTHNITASGQVMADETAILSTRVMGYIQAFYVKPGDAVTKGQLLISISSTDILARKAQAKAMVSEAEAAWADAQKDLERYRELYKQQSASEKELENMILRVESLAAKTEAARQMLRETDSMFAYTQIVAPFSGTVTQKMIDEGSMANPGMPLLIVEKKGNYKVSTSVTEAHIAKLRPGMEATIIQKSLPRKLTGTISDISPSSNNSGGRYTVNITIPPGRDALYSGMSATVLFSVAGSDTGTLLIPASAIIYKDQLAGVFTVSQSNTAMLRWIRLGRTLNDHIEVLSGLNATESFILSSERRLYNGTPVQIQSH